MIQFNNNFRKLLPVLMSAAVFLSGSMFLFAQEGIEKEVLVVRTFEPSVADASKINLLPSISDTISVSPVFDYTILPIPIATDFEVEPITPARMSAETVSRLYGSYIMLGLGSYISPYAELSINNLRHNKYSGGFYVKHHSARGRLKLDNDERAFSQFSDNNMLFYGKRMGRRNSLSADAGLKSAGFHYYGYDTSIDTIPVKDDIKQQFMHANTILQLKSNHIDSSYLNYNLRFEYDYFQDRLNVTEHGLALRSGFSKFVRSQVIGADIDFAYYNNTFIPDSSNLVVMVSPWFTKADEEWEVFAGFHAYYDQTGNESGVFFHPRASLQFSIIRNYVIPFVGIDGRLNVNHYRNVAMQNQFIVPGLPVKNSNQSMDLYTGVKGNFTRDLSFNFRVSYSVVEGMHFFVNDSTVQIGNQFTVVYDDVELLNYSGEIGADFSDRFNMLFRLNYYDYKLKFQEHPWHKPSVDMRLSAQYNLRNKILLSADVFYLGERFAKPVPESEEAITLKGMADINLGFEYRYNNILSGFVRLNNLTNARYYKWNNYPLHGLSLMAGFTYSL